MAHKLSAFALKTSPPLAVLDECGQSTLRRMSLDELKGGPAEAKRRRVNKGTTPVKAWGSIWRIKQMLKKSLLGISVAILVLSCFHLAHAKAAEQTVIPAPQDAVVAAEGWLKDIDQEKYEQSWVTASSYFKSMITKEEWVSQISAVRKSFGSLVSRKLNSKQFLSTLPGAPDGEYYVMTFNTVFQNKSQAVETVTMLKDKDSQWHSVGYYIK